MGGRQHCFTLFLFTKDGAGSTTFPYSYSLKMGQAGAGCFFIVLSEETQCRKAALLFQQTNYLHLPSSYFWLASANFSPLE
jgi:hypothetical protein